MKKSNNEKMVSDSIRMLPEMWAACNRYAEKLGLRSKNDFIRDAVDFYIEWLENSHTEKFLTPALESVIGGKIRDSEERLARLLFKLAVDQNLMAHIVGDGCEYSAQYLEQMRLRSVREVSSTNGTLSAAKIISGDS